MEIPRHWRLKKQRYKLVGEICEGDTEGERHYVFPPRDVCPDCGSQAKEAYEFSGNGTVYSYTTIYEAPTGFDSNTPYTVALVQLEEGPLITAQLTDLDGEPHIGMPVQAVTRRLREDGDERGIIIYGQKFRPAVPQG